MPSSTSSNSPAQEIDALSALLRRWQHEYFVLARPAVSDQEYDRAFDRLLALEKAHPELQREDSPTLRVGSDLTQELPEVPHTVPVLSLDKSYTVAELAPGSRRRQNAAGACPSCWRRRSTAPRSCSTTSAGLLARAVTRGNGLVGNDVTANVRTIGAVPLRLARPGHGRRPRARSSCRGRCSNRSMRAWRPRMPTHATWRRAPCTG